MIATLRTSSLPDHKEALEDELDQRDEEAGKSETESESGDRETCRGAERRRFEQLVSTSYLRDGQRSDDEESDKLTRQTLENETHPKRTSESGERSRPARRKKSKAEEKILKTRTMTPSESITVTQIFTKSGHQRGIARERGRNK